MPRMDGQSGAAESPRLPAASPVGNIACPLGPMASPHLTTPAWLDAQPNGFPSNPAPRGGYAGGEVTPGGDGLGSLNSLGGLGDIGRWGWEVGSECGSLPSAWSKPSTMHSGHSSRKSISSAAGDGLLPGLIEGQRLSTVKPSSLPTAGGKIVVSLRKEVPQEYWDHVEIVLVSGPDQVRLKPTGIKKGKKLCVEVPSGLTSGDYDVRLSFHSKILHGAIPLAIHDGEASSNEDMSNDEITEGLKQLGK